MPDQPADTRASRALRALVVALLGAALLAPAAGAAERYVVVYKPTVDRPGVRTERLQRAEDFRARLRYGHALKGFAASLTAAQVRALEADPAVDFVSPDRQVHGTAVVPLAAGDRTTAGVRRVRAGTATTTRQASTVNVAVLDSGIDPAADVNAVEGKNCVGTGPATDDNGHGTHVAGTLGARNGGSGVVGVAPGTREFSVKVLDADADGAWSQIICGIDWVTATRKDADPTNDVTVANLSLSGAGPAVRTCATTTDALHAAICRATGAGVTFVVAAGNDGWDFDHTTNPDVPAAYPEVLTVTAMGDTDGTGGATGAAPACRAGEADDRYASFSNYAATAAGQAHTVAAPGVCIESTARGGGLVTMSGTSMAAPHVAGLVALCFGEAGARGPCSGLTPAQVVAKVRGDAEAAARASAASGFAGDPLKAPLAGRHYGFLAALPATAAPAADTTRPGTGAVAPAAQAAGVAASAAVSVTFTEAMDRPATQAAFTLRRTSDGAAVTGVAGWSGTTLTFTPSAPLAAGTSYTARVTTAAKDVAGNALSAERSWSFTTAAGETSAVPFAAALLAGTSAGGTFASLAAADGVAYQVRSTASGTRQASWYAKVRGVPNALRSLRVSYTGRATAPCAQSVTVMNWVTSRWMTVDSRTAQTAAVTADQPLTGAALADFVSGTAGSGEVRVRIVCTNPTAAFTLAGDALRIAWS